MPDCYSRTIGPLTSTDFPPTSWRKGGDEGGKRIMNVIGLGPARNDGKNRLYAGNFDSHVYEYTWDGSFWEMSDQYAKERRR